MYTNTYRMAQGKVKQFDSSYERNYQKRNQKFGIPLSCKTVIKRYNPFKEKRGVFNTCKGDVTWRQSRKMLHYKHKADNIQLNKVCSGLLPNKYRFFYSPIMQIMQIVKGDVICIFLLNIWPIFLSGNGGVYITYNDL